MAFQGFRSFYRPFRFMRVWCRNIFFVSSMFKFAMYILRWNYAGIRRKGFMGPIKTLTGALACPHLNLRN